jgi:hypothetical protein
MKVDSCLLEKSNSVVSNKAPAPAQNGSVLAKWFFTMDCFWLHS